MENNPEHDPQDTAELPPITGTFEVTEPMEIKGDLHGNVDGDVED